MPELPEVETIVRTLAPRIEGRVIRTFEVLAERVFRGEPCPELPGRRIASVSRHGKHILMRFHGGGVLSIHLGMTGKLLLDGERTPYLRAAFGFDNGSLVFDDVRQFGRFRYGASQLPHDVAKLGPEPFDAGFAQRLRARRGAVKPLLLNQEFVRGLGNIYVDEALFRAGIHPKASAERLSAARAEALHREIVAVLHEAIARGGSSISDYVDADGNRGDFQSRHQVYGREGEPCCRCGKLIQRIVLAQRGTHFCAGCQRR